MLLRLFFVFFFLFSFSLFSPSSLGKMTPVKEANKHLQLLYDKIYKTEMEKDAVAREKDKG